jgi:hypothetical protein
MSAKIITKAADVERPFYNVECPESTFLQCKSLLFMALRDKRRKRRKISEVTPPYCSFFSNHGMKAYLKKTGNA